MKSLVPQKQLCKNHNPWNVILQTCACDLLQFHFVTKGITAFVETKSYPTLKIRSLLHSEVHPVWCIDNFRLDELSIKKCHENQFNSRFLQKLKFQNPLNFSIFRGCWSTWSWPSISIKFWLSDFYLLCLTYCQKIGILYIRCLALPLSKIFWWTEIEGGY